MAMAAPAEEEDHSAAEEEEDNTTNPTEATGVTKEEPSTRIFLVTIDIGTLQRNWNENKEIKISGQETFLTSVLFTIPTNP